MAGARRYRLLATWGVVQIVAGCLVMIAAALAVLAVLSPWPADFVAKVPSEWRTRVAPAPLTRLLLAILVGGSLAVRRAILVLLRGNPRHSARPGPRAPTAAARCA